MQQVTLQGLLIAHDIVNIHAQHVCLENHLTSTSEIHMAVWAL